MATLKLKIDKALGDVKDKNQRESGQTAYKPCLKELLVLILGQPPRRLCGVKQDLSYRRKPR